MREFYRWEHGLPFGAALPREAVGGWLARRESTLGGARGPAPSCRCPSAGPRVRSVRRRRRQRRPWRRSAWSTARAWPARSGRSSFSRSCTQVAAPRRRPSVLQVCGREHARGLFAPPAALVGGDTIVLRRESLARWLWEKFEAFSLRRADGPCKRVVRGLRTARHASLRRRAAAPGRRAVRDRWCCTSSASTVPGAGSEPGWAAMRLALDERRTDLRCACRARPHRRPGSHAADPARTRRGDALHFWFANYEGVREQMFPALSRGLRRVAWRRCWACAAGCGANRRGAFPRVGGARCWRLHERPGPATPRPRSSTC